MAAFDLHEVLDALPAETSPPTEPILAIEPTSGFIPLAQLRVGEVQRIRAYVVKVYKHGMIMLGDRSSRLYARKPATIQVQLGQCVEAQVLSVVEEGREVITLTFPNPDAVVVSSLAESEGPVAVKVLVEAFYQIRDYLIAIDRHQRKDQIRNRALNLIDSNIFMANDYEVRALANIQTTCSDPYLGVLKDMDQKFNDLDAVGRLRTVLGRKGREEMERRAREAPRNRDHWELPHQKVQHVVGTGIESHQENATARALHLLAPFLVDDLMAGGLEGLDHVTTLEVSKESDIPGIRRLTDVVVLTSPLPLSTGPNFNMPMAAEVRWVSLTALRADLSASSSVYRLGFEEFASVQQWISVIDQVIQAVS